jgi:outer membrane protein assembly factor BamB
VRVLHPSGKRNRKNFVAIWALVLGLAALFGNGVAFAEDWPRWGGPRGDETWSGPDVLNEWPETGLAVRFRQPIGGGYSGVAVAQGRVYVHDYIKTPTESERVLCFDAQTGAPLWTHAYPVAYAGLDYGSGPRATPTVLEGRVYTFGAVGQAHCLDAVTGAVVWSIDFVKDHGAVLPTWGLAAAAVIDGPRVLFHAGLKEGGTLVACDRQTGEIVWRGGADPAGYAAPILIDAPSGRQVVCWSPEHVLGLSPVDGTVLWKVPYKVTYGVSIATPLYRNGLLFVSGYWEGSKAIRLGAAPGETTLAWQENRNLRGLMSQPIERNGSVYTLDKQYGVTCFDLETGKKRWDDKNTLTARGRNPQVTLTWLQGSDRVLSVNAEGELLLSRFTPESFELLARTPIIEPAEPTGVIWAHPAYAGDAVFVRSDRELVCRPLPVRMP